jgi:hypothetical protein
MGPWGGGGQGGYRDRSRQSRGIELGRNVDFEIRDCCESRPGDIIIL